MNLPNTDAVAGGGEVQPWQSYHTVYTNAKAGMDGVDKEKVQRTVYEMSKGSKYFENEQRKEAYMQKRIENLRGQAALLTASDIAHFEKVADRRVLELEAARDVSRIWVHVDMDAFYAAVETLENPSLAGKPMAVGSMSMICTANYEARKFGIRAAMPGFIARKLCPELIFVPTNFEKYSHYSELTRQVFREYDSRFIARSLDEAYLDITDVCRQRCMSGEKVADELREGIYFRTGLTCSAGVAPNRLLAKVCSDINKPNGQFVLPNERPAVMTFVSSLPIRKVSGIGKVTERMLKDALGINTCEDLLHRRALVCALFSRCSADFFLSVGLGLGGSEAPQEEHRKSISSERTFLATNNEVDLFQKLEDIADTLSNDMDKEGLRGRTLTLKLKTAAFEVRTRAVSLQLYIHSRADILHHASKLLKAELPLSLRLIGLRISQFKDDNSGLSDLTQKTLTSYINSGNVTREIGSPEKHPDAQNSVCYLTESDGRDKNDFSILENEMHAADAVHPHIADSPCKCYNPWFLVNCVSHGAYTVKHDITGRQNKVSEHIGSENFTENEGSAKIENHHADFVSRVNLVEDGHLHQCGGQLHFKVEASTTAGDQTECKHIDMDTNEKASYSNSLSSAGILQGTSRNLEFNLENNNDHIPNESSMKMSELELHGIFCANNMSKAKVDLQSEFSNIMFWIDDCCCSLCGAELPMDFIQERQEHYDYHLAQMLQQEESPSMNAEQESQQQTKRPRWSAEKPSRGRKHVGNKLVNSQKKKKHLPIDSFFIKSLHHS